MTTKNTTTIDRDHLDAFNNATNFIRELMTHIETLEAQVKMLQERVDRYGALMFDVVSDDQIMHDDEGLIACPVCHKVHYWSDDTEPHEKDCTYEAMKDEASLWWSDYIRRKEK